MTGLFNDFSTAGATGGAWRGNADDLARWGLGFTSPVDGRTYHWNPDNTTTANNCLCADPALDDDNTIKEDVDAVYMQVAMRGELGKMPTNLLVGVRYEQTDVTSTARTLVPNKPGGMLVYRRNSLHSGCIAKGFVPDPNPLTGRLSINCFIDAVT